MGCALFSCLRGVSNIGFSIIIHNPHQNSERNCWIARNQPIFQHESQMNWALLCFTSGLVFSKGFSGGSSVESQSWTLDEMSSTCHGYRGKPGLPCTTLAPGDSRWLPTHLRSKKHWPFRWAVQVCLPEKPIKVEGWEACRRIAFSQERKECIRDCVLTFHVHRFASSGLAIGYPPPISHGLRPSPFSNYINLQYIECYHNPPFSDTHMIHGWLPLFIFPIKSH